MPQNVTKFGNYTKIKHFRQHAASPFEGRPEATASIASRSYATAVIPTSNVSEIIYDTSTETESANNKSHDSFQVIRLSMTLTIFQGH